MKQAGNRFRRKKLLALLIIFFLSSYKVLGNESNAHNYRSAWWFKSIYLTAIVLMCYCLYRLRIRKLLAVERARQRLGRDLHDDIGSTLSTISILSSMAKNKLDHDPVKVSEYIEKINDN